MTMLELRLKLSDQFARDARRAGLLTPEFVTQLLKEAMSVRRAAADLLEGAARATKARSKPMSLDEIQREVDVVRRARRMRAGAGKRR